MLLSLFADVETSVQKESELTEGITNHYHHS